METIAETLEYSEGTSFEGTKFQYKPLFMAFSNLLLLLKLFNEVL